MSYRESEKTGNLGSLKLRVNYSIMNVKYVVPSDIMYWKSSMDRLGVILLSISSQKRVNVCAATKGT